MVTSSPDVVQMGNKLCAMAMAVQMWTLFSKRPGLSRSQNSPNRRQIWIILAGEKRLLSASRASTALLPRSCLFALKAGGKSSTKLQFAEFQWDMMTQVDNTFKNGLLLCFQTWISDSLNASGCPVAQAHFGCLWGANSFRTPPGGRGFKAHHDEVEARSCLVLREG